MIQLGIFWHFEGFFWLKEVSCFRGLEKEVSQMTESLGTLQGQVKKAEGALHALNAAKTTQQTMEQANEVG